MGKGINAQLADEVLNPLRFDPDVIKSDSRQAPQKYSFVEYQKKAVNPNRVKNGQNFYRRHRQELEHYAGKAGVPASVIVALLGIETDYGGFTGKNDVIQALASLAYGAQRSDPAAQKKRRDYFRTQIYYSLKLLQDKHIERDDFKGSWAGAFGINQHMPESFYTYVVDGDGDGDKEILNMNDLSDVFATTANHLHKVGWKEGQRWGREVALPANFPKTLVGNSIKKPLSFWRSAGVTLPGGAPLPASADIQGSIIAPDGLQGPVYIGYDNFHAFRRWNKSDYFALVVGTLSDKIAQP
ncbi:MAG: lytic murein transglycosylase [Alphaproteobacteria bacterium]|nr:lytic murein transglycosylase [Alphaproteobacteria bacterium]